MSHYFCYFLQAVSLSLLDSVVIVIGEKICQSLSLKVLQTQTGTTVFLKTCLVCRTIFHVCFGAAALPFLLFEKAQNTLHLQSSRELRWQTIF